MVDSTINQLSNELLAWLYENAQDARKLASGSEYQRGRMSAYSDVLDTVRTVLKHIEWQMDKVEILFAGGEA